MNSKAFKFKFHESKKVFMSLPPAKEFPRYAKTIRKRGKDIVTDVCCTFYALHQHIFDTTIELCQKDGLSFSNKKATISINND